MDSSSSSSSSGWRDGWDVIEAQKERERETTKGSMVRRRQRRLISYSVDVLCLRSLARAVQQHSLILHGHTFFCCCCCCTPPHSGPFSFNCCPCCRCCTGLLLISQTFVVVVVVVVVVCFQFPTWLDLLLAPPFSSNLSFFLSVFFPNIKTLFCCILDNSTFPGLHRAVL